MILLADKLNTSLHETTKATPYQLCFGQPPHSSSFPGATTGSIMEEAVSDILGMYIYHVFNKCIIFKVIEIMHEIKFYCDLLCSCRYL